MTPDKPASSFLQNWKLQKYMLKPGMRNYLVKIVKQLASESFKITYKNDGTDLYDNELQEAIFRLQSISQIRNKPDSLDISIWIELGNLQNEIKLKSLTAQDPLLFWMLFTIKQGKAVPLRGDMLTLWKTESAKITKHLENKESLCYKYLDKVGFNPILILNNLRKQIPYDGLSSTNDAGLEFGVAGISVKQWFEDYKNSHPRKEYPDAATAYSGNIYYIKAGLKSSIILHETIHSTFESKTIEWTAYLPDDPASDSTTGVKKLGKARISDDEIRDILKITKTLSTRNITTKLEEEMCK